MSDPFVPTPGTSATMTDVPDRDTIRAFAATHARPLDRRRLELALGDADPAPVLTALACYANPDGGYGGGLEPDLRSTSSQPVPALHAFEVFAEIAPHITPAAAALCDWLDAVSLPDGGLPFARPIPDPAGCAPFFVDGDPTVSSLHVTAMLAGLAHRVAEHDPAVRAHPWLARASGYARRGLRALDSADNALQFRYALQFLDATHATDPAAAAELTRLGARLPADGRVPVPGGTADEAMRPLDFSPEPDRPLRALFAPAVIAADLDRLAAEQQADGGWTVDWTAYSPLAALEWRGWATVRAVRLLTAHGRGPV